ncbi:hypothetical protein LguiB_021030 [Lonicera macranthoides]
MLSSVNSISGSISISGVKLFFQRDFFSVLSVHRLIHKLLHPHFHDTMNINALARQTLINAGGLLEMTVFPIRYAMEWSATSYKDWVSLNKHSLRNAVEDSNSSHGLRLLIQDYPFAVDGLEIWSAIKTWVGDYFVNFGQYPYGGYPPNPEKAYLKTITSQLQSVLGISLIEIVSRHLSNEVFLGQRDTAEWTTDMEAIKAFGRFGKKLEEIE